MSHTYRHCRKCGIDRDQIAISSRGLCPKCATQKAMQAAIAACAIGAALQFTPDAAQALLDSEGRPGGDQPV